MNERAEWIAPTMPHRILEPDPRPDEPTIPRIRHREAAFCPLERLCEKQFVRRIAAHDPIKRDDGRSRKLARRDQEIAVTNSVDAE